MKISIKAKNAYLEKGRKWPTFVIFYVDGTRRKFSKHLDWLQSERMLAEIRNRITLGTFDLSDYTSVRVRSEEIGRAVVEYIAERERSVLLNGLSKATLGKDKYSLALFMDFIGKRTLLANITKTDMENFVLWLRTEKQTQYGKNYSEAGIRSTTQSIATFFARGVEKGYLEKSPLSGFFKKSGILKEYEAPKFATTEQIEAIRDILKNGPEWKLDSFNFSLWTSARVSEVLAVKKSDVYEMRKGDEKKMVIRLFGKGGKYRMVPLGPDCEALVRKRLKWLETGEAMREAQSRSPHPQNAEIYKQRWEQGYLFHDVAHRKSLSDAVLHARRLAGIDRKITFHSARHTYATEMLGKGVALAAISKVMGHTETRTTEIYAKLVDDALMDILDGVPEI